MKMAKRGYRVVVGRSPARVAPLVVALLCFHGAARAQTPCPSDPLPPDTCPLLGGAIECFCCGTCDSELSPGGTCWPLSFIDGSDKCDPQGQDGGKSGADGTDVADFDGDGDLDVVTGYEEGGGVQVYLNPCNPVGGAPTGGCTSGNLVMAEWPKVQVDGGVTVKSIEDASFGDLDGDCLPDAVISSMEGTTDKACIHYYIGPDRTLANLVNENNWQGECLPNRNKNYMRARVGQLYPRTQAAADNLPNSCDAANPPGCNDIVVGAKSDDSTNGETLLWYECPAGGATDPTMTDQWVRHLIGRGEWFMSVELVDMDDDRDLDVLYSDRRRVGWFENPYDSSSPPGPDFAALARVRGEWPRHVIEGPGALSGEEGPYGASPECRWLTHFDLDEDGDTDIITTVNYDMGQCPDGSTNCGCVEGSPDNCDGDSFGIPGLRIMGHWYERRIVCGAKPADGVSFDVGVCMGAAGGETRWLQFIRHVIAADNLPFRDEDTPEPPDEWVSKAVAVGDVMGDAHPELVFTTRGSGHGIFALLSNDPTAMPDAFGRNGQGASEPLNGQIWTARKISTAYLDRSGMSTSDDGRKEKYDNIQLVDLDHNGSLDVLTSEENAGNSAPGDPSPGLGTVWYANPCGNGALDPGEECDLGTLNGNDNVCCTLTCRFRTGAMCRASTRLCDAAEVCRAGNPYCPTDVNEPAGTPCSTSACDAFPKACNASGVCETLPGKIACDGNLECATGLCLSGFCAAACDDDGNPCTYDACNGGICTHGAKAPGTLCTDDGDPCTTNTCDGAGNCVANDCGVETECRRCASDGATCEFVNESNGTSCTGGAGDCRVGTCQSGLCETVPAPAGTSCSSDGNACTRDECNGVNFACVHFPLDGTPCGDNPDPNNPCEEQNVCSPDFGGTCLQRSNFGDVCREAVHECDAVERCTVPDLTDGGQSICPEDGFRTGRSCTDDGEFCTLDECDDQGQCTHPPVADGLICPGGECSTNTCQGGKCVQEPTPGESCTPDANRCTAEVCSVDGKCESVPVANGTPCSVLDWDDSDCTGDICIDGVCAHPPLPEGSECGWSFEGVCNDRDACDGAGNCLDNHWPDGTACSSDGLACTADACRNGVCQHTPIDSSLLPDGLCGFEFSPIGGGIVGLQVDPRGVEDLATFNDGSGSALYATGAFALADESSLDIVVRWDGKAWSIVGKGPSDPTEGLGDVLAVFDDGNGPALYAAGWFHVFTLEQNTEFLLMKWDGASWTNVDPGFNFPSYNSTIATLAVYNDGNGEALYVGGSFSEIDGTPVNRVVKWDGTTWSSVGTGLDGPSDVVHELAVVDLGTGPKLYAGGQFTAAGGSEAQGIAVLEGGDWVPLGDPRTLFSYDAGVWAIAGFDSGTGTTLHIAVLDFFYNPRVSRWTGSSWETVGDVDGNGAIYDLYTYDDGSGPALYVGGSFDGIDGIASPNVIRYRDGAWESLRQCVSGAVRTLASHDDGTGDALIIGGYFRDVGGPEGDRVARWGCTGDNDCNDNLMPDELDPDCDGSGTPDDCDLLAGGIDCQPNGVLDTCELDTQDENRNGLPDDCDLFQKYDWSADCAIDIQDMPGLADCIRGPEVGAGSICRFVFDQNQDDDVDLADAAAFFNHLGTTPPLLCE